MKNDIFTKENIIPFNKSYLNEGSNNNNIYNSIIPEYNESISSYNSYYFEKYMHRAFNNTLNRIDQDNINELNSFSNEKEDDESITDELLYFVNEKPNNKTNKTMESTRLNEEQNINQNEQMIVNDIENKFQNTFINKIYNSKSCNKENIGLKIKDEIKGRDNNNKTVHDKYAPDNIRLKFKRVFLHNLITFINLLIDKSSKLKKKGKIYKIDNNIVKNTKKIYILKMLDMSAKEYLSLPIIKKVKKLDRDHNKKMIEYIYEVNEISIIEVLSKTIRELMYIFCSNIIEDNIFKHFKRLQNYINNTLSNEDQLYIEKFKYQALNYEDEYKKLDGRYEGKP